MAETPTSTPVKEIKPTYENAVASADLKVQKFKSRFTKFTDFLKVVVLEPGKLADVVIDATVDKVNEFRNRTSKRAVEIVVIATEKLNRGANRLARRIDETQDYVEGKVREVADRGKVIGLTAVADIADTVRQVRTLPTYAMEAVSDIQDMSVNAGHNILDGIGEFLNQMARNGQDRRQAAATYRANIPRQNAARDILIRMQTLPAQTTTVDGMRVIGGDDLGDTRPNISASSRLNSILNDPGNLRKPAY